MRHRGPAGTEVAPRRGAIPAVRCASAWKTPNGGRVIEGTICPVPALGPPDVPDIRRHGTHSGNRVLYRRSCSERSDCRHGGPGQSVPSITHPAVSLFHADAHLTDRNAPRRGALAPSRTSMPSSCNNSRSAALTFRVLAAGKPSAIARSPSPVSRTAGWPGQFKPDIAAAQQMRCSGTGRDERSTWSWVWLQQAGTAGSVGRVPRFRNTRSPAMTLVPWSWRLM